MNSIPCGKISTKQWDRKMIVAGQLPHQGHSACTGDHTTKGFCVYDIDICIGRLRLSMVVAVPTKGRILCRKYLHPPAVEYRKCFQRHISPSFYTKAVVMAIS